MHTWSIYNHLLTSKSRITLLLKFPDVILAKRPTRWITLPVAQLQRVCSLELSNRVSTTPHDNQCSPRRPCVLPIVASVYWCHPITCPCLTSRNPIYFWESRTLSVSPTKTLSPGLPQMFCGEPKKSVLSDYWVGFRVYTLTFITSNPTVMV